MTNVDKPSVVECEKVVYVCIQFECKVLGQMLSPPVSQGIDRQVWTCVRHLRVLPTQLLV